MRMMGAGVVSEPGVVTHLVFHPPRFGTLCTLLSASFLSLISPHLNLSSSVTIMQKTSRPCRRLSAPWRSARHSHLDTLNSSALRNCPLSGTRQGGTFHAALRRAGAILSLRYSLRNRHSLLQRLALHRCCVVSPVGARHGDARPRELSPIPPSPS